MFYTHSNIILFSSAHLVNHLPKILYIRFKKFRSLFKHFHIHKHNVLKPTWPLIISKAMQGHHLNKISNMADDSSFNFFLLLNEHFKLLIFLLTFPF